MSGPPKDLPLKVLIVEDEPLVAMAAEQSLVHEGHRVVGIAADAETAFRIATETKIDLALVDLNLRDGLTGLEIADALIRKHGVAVLFVTANPEMLQGFEGGIGILNKPYNMPSLVGAVDYVRAWRAGNADEQLPPVGLKLLMGQPGPA